MDADSFHRLEKLLADSGEAETIEAAQATFASYGLRVILDDSVTRDVGAQVIALTAINAASRSFMGNVLIDADEDVALTAPGFGGMKLSEFATWAGVNVRKSEHAKRWPQLYPVGICGRSCEGAVLAWADGWTFGIGVKPAATGAFFAPACVAAAGLAVSEAFSLLRRDNPYAGRRSISLNLWDTGQNGNECEAQQPDVTVPSAWLVGLGHLGQAYAWTLGFMRVSENTKLVLQDVDTVTRSTLSTSLLSTPADIGHKKTRVTARWLESRGYHCSLVERRFDQLQRVSVGEPRLALFGVDNAAARRVLEGAGFDEVIDAGLGSGFKDFRAIRIRRFPGPSSAAELWATSTVETSSVRARAYQALIAEGADTCGVTTLATRAVGAPFVGCVAAGFALAEMQRRRLGSKGNAVVDLNLRDPSAMQTVQAA